MATVVFLLILIFLFIQVRTVQVYLAKKGAAYLSEKLHTRVQIGSVDIELFKRLVLEEVYIEDLHQDTLLYAKQIKLEMESIELARHQLYVSSVSLVDAKAALVKYKGEDDLNLQFIIDAFQSNDTTKNDSTINWDIHVKDVVLKNINFKYQLQSHTDTVDGINYNDLDVRNISAEIYNTRIVNDTIFGFINNMAAKEKSGFILNNLTCAAKVSAVEMQLDGLKIETPDSKIATNLKFEYSSYRDYNDFINKVNIRASFNHAVLDLDDIAYFAPAMRGTYKKFILSGDISGRVNNIKGKKMDILLENTSTQFVGDIKLTGLPDIDETLIYLNVVHLKTNYYDLKQLAVPPFDKNQTLNVPDNVAKLGNMNFTGTFTGLYNDFYAYGNFSSALGKVYTDLSVQHDAKRDKEFYKGKIKSTDFNFGEFLGVPMMGKVTSDINIDGTGVTLDEIAVDLKGTINSLEFKNYSYNNIAVEGGFAKQIFKGKLNVKDDNVDLDFNGNIDFTGDLPTLDFIATLSKADLAALNFLNTMKKTNLSTQLIINVTGNNIDNLIGHLNIDNTIYEQDGEIYKMSSFTLNASEQGGTKTIKVASDFVDAKVSGRFKMLELPRSIEHLLSNYLPSYFDKTTIVKRPIPQQFEYSFAFKKTDAVTRLFIPKLSIAPKTIFKGNFNSVADELNITGSSPRIAYDNFALEDCEIMAVTDENLLCNLSCKRFYLSDSSWLGNFSLVTTTLSDSLNLALLWNNKEKKEYSGDIKSFVYFGADKTIKLSVLPSEFTVADSLWTISKNNEVFIDSSYIKVQGLALEHSGQLFALDGALSKDPKEELKLELVDFNLQNLNPFTEVSGVKFEGRVNGKSVITDFYHHLLFASNNSFKDLFINDNPLGDGNVATVWDNSREALTVNGSFSQGIVPNLSFSGYYYPKLADDNIDLKLNFQAMQLQIFEPFIEDICSDFKGFFAGNINVKGSTKKPLLSGALNINAKKVTVSYLNTTYNFSHDLTIENNSFGVENLELYDMNHNKAMVSGKVYHNNFKNFQLDFDIQPQKFMCLNTTEANNASYYGRAYVSGIVNISGFTDNILIEANVKTESVNTSYKPDKINLLSKTELTKFFIPLSNTEEVSENNFITFVKKDNSLIVKNDYKVKLGGLTLDFDLDVTPDAEVQLIFDQKVGDVIRSRGNGDIKLEINSKGDFKMFGDYVIDNGDYLLTLKNIINKRFDLDKGGTIKWSGIPYDAEINVSATYKARASLKPFFSGADSTNSIYKVRYPIDLKLLMTNDLLSPTITFDIGMPTVDASIRQQVMTYLNTEAEMNRQVFSLLVLNSFLTPNQLNGAGGGATVGSAAGANTSELLSNQLSNMLSKISKDFDIGVNYRPGDEITKDELAVALSTQLFNDKVTIDGNVGRNTTNTQNTNSIVGDVNVEYKLTDDGKLRIKAYNRANDNSLSFSNGPYTQGVGVFYREEFNSFGDLLAKYWSGITRKRKKKSTVEKTPPNTTITVEPTSPDME